MIKLALVSTKGGVGKTTLAANLGALLADMGLRVLLIDADEKPSISKFFPLRFQAPHGLTQVITRGVVTREAISEIDLPHLSGALDIVVSDSPEINLSDWLYARIDRAVRLKLALRSPDVVDRYDCVILDAHGGNGAVEDAVALAADLLISPVRPDVLSGSEFMDGTLRMLERLDASSAIGAGLGPMKAVINCLRRTNNSRLVADAIRANFLRAQGRVTMLDTVIPDANVYQAAATAQVPVHRFDRQRGGASPSAYEVMHRLAWELIPSLQGMYAGQVGHLRVQAAFPTHEAAHVG
jgi:chromosome partitioning related protein ParA